MAATDQHYRSQKTLDVVFAVSCGLMLLTTVWMFVQDYNRSFKTVQRKFRDVEATMAERELVDRLPDSESLTQRRVALRRAREGVEDAKAAAILGNAEEVAQLRRLTRAPETRDTSEGAEAKRKLSEAIAQFEAKERKLRAEFDAADANYRTIKADLDSQESLYNIEIDTAGKYPLESSSYANYKKRADKIAEEVRKLRERLTAAKIKLDEIEATMRRELREPLAAAERLLATREEEMKALTAVSDRFAKLAAQKAWTTADTFRALPIIDGFESPIKINQIWLPDLTIDYGGFRDVPRFDRCTTCHLGIEKGTYTKEMLAKLGDEKESSRLTTKLVQAKEELSKRARAGENLGFDPNDLPGERQGNLGVIALILAGCVLIAALSLGVLQQSLRLGVLTLFAGLVLTLATTTTLAWFSPRVTKVKSIALTEAEIKQYAAHPRLDLFVDSNSPHPSEKFGCTICHAGQGSATEFNNASHTPNDYLEYQQWKKDYHYHPSHYWDFPMLANRFIESSCLKCHHEITDLVREGGKEEAPKLLKGYQLVRENGCFGCHEIHGLKSGRPVGPDMRLEPAPALEWLSPSEQEKLKADSANPPGTYRKVGPSLRRLSEKVNLDWTVQWILDPRGFRPDTRMPHFYDLSTNNKEFLAKHAPGQENFPAAEMHAISHYLIEESKKALQGKDSYRESLLKGKQNLHQLQQQLIETGLNDRDQKTLFDVSKRFSDLALLSAPRNASRINSAAATQRALQDRLLELHKRGGLTDEIRGSVAKRLATLEKNEKRTPAEEAELKQLKAIQAQQERSTKDFLISLEVRVKELEAVPSRSPEETRELEQLKDLKQTALELEAVTASLIEAGKPVPLTKDNLINEDGDKITLPEKSGDPAKGLELFTEKGCQACHAHEKSSVPSEANFGPELSRIADKLGSGEQGRLWLVQWLMNPNIYHPRTRMPITHLTPTEANDLAAWLLSQKTGWQGKATDPARPDLKTYVELARVYLGKAPGVTVTELDRFLPADGTTMPGIPADKLATFSRDADERALAEGQVTEDRLKWYIGRKAIGRLGCYACHDIPGFETAKPIGVALNDWGVKEGDKLAFEDAEAFVRTHFNIVPTRKTRTEIEARIKELEEKGEARSKAEDAELEKLQKQIKEQARIDELERKAIEQGLTSKEQKELHGLKKLKFFESLRGANGENKPPFEEAFYHALEHHQREGFLHLKLFEPRSYDYNRMRPWDDRLRMPQFKFARSRQKAGESDTAYAIRLEKEEAEAREAVMTFILGLVAEPMPAQYLHKPTPEKQAEIIGRQVLDKFNCAGCHQIRPGVFEFDSRSPEVMSLLTRSYTEQAVNYAKDHVFQGHNAWFGTNPTSDLLRAYGYRDSLATQNVQEVEGLEGVEVIRLAEALRFAGPDKVMRDLREGTNVYLRPGTYRETAPFGGTWTDLMVPYLNKKDSTKFPPADPAKSRTVLPPPLLREGERVQPDWLYKFLLNPHPVRPQYPESSAGLLLRMPKFNLSPEDARALVNYFTAVSKMGNPGAGVTSPFVYIPQRDPEYWRHSITQHEQSVQALLKQAKDEVGKPDVDPEKAKQWQARIKLIEEGLAANQKVPNHSKVKDLYSRQAYNLLTHKSLCLTCHSIGPVQITGAQGPNLALASERLRPEWVEQWVAQPVRMFPYSPVMPQNFPYEADPLKWEFQEAFVGSPLQQTKAVRDLIMDLPRLTDLLTTSPPTIPPPAAATGDKK